MLTAANLVENFNEKLTRNISELEKGEKGKKKGKVKRLFLEAKTKIETFKKKELVSNLKYNHIIFPYFDTN